ncbi:MAG: choline-sulfatase, partial [bacterium]|nr:choline-sulfatase [bacterium]
YEAQLFDLEEDPGEWRNLCGDPAHAETEKNLRTAILERFDPDAIAGANLESLHRRWVIRQTMQQNGQSWAHFPHFDARRNASAQYLP